MNHALCQPQSRRPLLYRLLWLFGFLPLVYSVSPAQVPPSLSIGNFGLSQPSQPPRRADFINDEAGVLTETEFAELSRLLTQHNERGPGRLLVCLIRRLPEEQTMREFALTYLNQQPGHWYEKTDHILVLIVTDRARVCLQVGAAFTDILPEPTRNRILNETIDPAIEAKAYFQGLNASLNELSHALQTSPIPPAGFRQIAVGIVRSLLTWLGLFVLLLGSSTILLTTLHEAAHALVARLVGLRVYRITIGYGRRLFAFRLGRVKVELHLIPFGGATQLAARYASGRWRMWLAVAAGPGLHVALACLFNYLEDHEPFSSQLFYSSHTWLAAFMQNLATINMICLISNLLPYRTGDANGVAASDGYQMLKIPFMTAAELEQYQVAELLHRAKEQSEAGEPEQALAAAEAAWQQFPENRAIRFSLAHHRLGVGDYEQAYADFKALLDTCEADSERDRRLLLLNNLAYAGALLNRPDLLVEADQYSAEALQSAPAIAAFTGTRGAVLLRLGRVTEGVTLLQRSHKQLSDRPRERGAEAGWLALGEALQGKFNEAANWLEKARADKPEQCLLQQLEQEIQALRDGQTVVEPQPPTPPTATLDETVAQQQIEYTLARADYFAYAAHQFRRARLTRVIYWALYIVGIFLLPTGWTKYVSGILSMLVSILLLMAWGVVLDLCSEVFTYWLAQARVELMLRNAQRHGRLAPQTLMLSPSHLTHSKAGSEIRAGWERLRRLELSGMHCFYTLGGGRAYIVPLSAFASPLEAGSFAELAVTYWQQTSPKKRELVTQHPPLLAVRVQRQPIALTAALIALGILASSFQRLPAPPVQAEAGPDALRYDANEGTTKFSSLYQIAAKQRAEQDYDNAEATYQFITQLEPLNAPGFVGLGAIHHLQERLAKAEQDYCHAHSLDQRSVSALIGLGSVLMDRQDYAHAEAIYRQALRLAPQSVEAHYCVARAARRQGKEAQAREHFHRVNELAPNSDYAKYAR